jgi:predicted transcriptional regulator
MVSQGEIDRLRLEADTIMTRYEQVEQALERARKRSGDQWETGELPVTLESPTGESLTVTLDFDADPATNAQSRYERANELEAALERKQRVVERLKPLPAHPVAYLICYHLNHVDGNYPKSMAGYLEAARSRVEDLCKEMDSAGILERIESGTVKQRNVKAKQADEVRQHHTYYRLSREGDHLLRFLSEREGQLNVLRHLPDGQTIVQQLVDDGPSSPRLTAESRDLQFEYVRHLYRALRQVGLVVEHDDSPARENRHESRTSADDERDHTYFAATDRADDVLRDLEE